MSSYILIKGATVVTMNESNDIIQNGDILIENDTIKSVGTSIPDELPESLKVISGKNKVVIPGLINLHNHAAMTLFRSFADDLPLQEWLQTKIFPAEERLTAEDVYWGSSLAILEMLKGGTTTFVDMYFFMDEVAKACCNSGIRAVLSQGIIGTNSIIGYQSLQKAKSFAFNWHNQAGGRITTMLGPHAPYTCPPKFLQKVIDEADKLNSPIHIHLAETRKEVEDCLNQYKKTPIKLVNEIGLFERNVLAAHCVHLSDDDINLLVSKQVGIAHNPSSNLKLGSGIAPLRDLIKEGARVGLGTDGAASNNNLDMFEEMRLAALLQKGYHKNPSLVPATQALGMATREGAKALNMNNLGVIEPGYKADMAILDFKKPHLQPHLDTIAHIVYSASASDVETVIVDGKILVENGCCLTLDEEKIYAEVSRRAKKLTQP